MRKIWLLVFFAIAWLTPALANAQLHHCACIHNETNNAVEFKWSVPDAMVHRTYTKTVTSRGQALLCHNEGLFETLSDRQLDKAAVDVDVDLTAAVRNQRFDVALAKVNSQTCAAIPQTSHFLFSLDPVNPMSLTFMGRPSGNFAAPAVYPAAPTSAYPYPAAAPGAPFQGYAPPAGYPATAPGYPTQGYAAPTYGPPPPGYPPQGYAPPAYPTSAPSLPTQGYPAAAYYPAPATAPPAQPGFVPIAPGGTSGATAPGSYTPRAPLF